MMQFAQSLVQIHYHDRIGGVRRVMHEYSEAFAQIAGSDAPNYRICSRSGAWSCTCGGFIDMPDADYHCYRSAAALRRDTVRLTRQLLSCIESLPLRFPAAIIGHNLNLGKNPALSAAFRNCARMLGADSGRMRFYSVMHDFVEAGRMDLLSMLKSLARQGADPYPGLYCTGAPVRFIVPDRLGKIITGLGADSLTVLPHPVRQLPFKGGSFSSAQSLRERLAGIARSDNMRFDPQKRLYLYPSRMIHRKNVLEALLVATVICDGALATGPCGGNAQDRRLMKQTVDIARRFDLSFVTDVARISGADGHPVGQVSPFTSLYRAAWAVISTSTNEGYGFSLVEPWLYGRGVIGRRPAGTAFAPGVGTASLYDRLPVPAEWVSLRECFIRIKRTYVQAFARPYISFEKFRSATAGDGTVDFALLDGSAQADIVARVLRSDADRADMCALLSRERPGLSGFAPPDAQNVALAANAVREWSSEGFRKDFVKCLSASAAPPDAKWFLKIGAYWRAVQRFEPPMRRTLAGRGRKVYDIS